LERASLFYREAALYAEMTDAGAATIVALADRHGPAASA